jgi:hypothetical protein
MEKTEYGHGIDPKHARAQGADAREQTDDESNDVRILPQDCPYSPGELADAWLAGYKAPKEGVEQVDTSTANNDDVRREPAKQVRKAGSAKRSSKRKGKGPTVAEQPMKATTDVTGNAETSLPTTRGPDKPEDSATENVTTKLGDPRADEGDRTAIDKNDLM